MNDPEHKPKFPLPAQAHSAPSGTVVQKVPHKGSLLSPAVQELRAFPQTRTWERSCQVSRSPLSVAVEMGGSAAGQDSPPSLQLPGVFPSVAPLVPIATGGCQEEKSGAPVCLSLSLPLFLFSALS